MTVAVSPAARVSTTFGAGLPTSPVPTPPPERPIPTVDEILAADPDEFVANYTDIAAINLACAVGLPKAEDLDIPKCLAAIDAMAVVVRRKTAKSMHLYDTCPEQYRHSKNVFRVVFMLHTLHQQFGVRYNPDKAHLTRDDEGVDEDATDSADKFIHGILSPRRSGTCASLPVFAVAVGRRLGYPLKLVPVPEHLLFRWDDGVERCNFEFHDGPGEIHPDEFYHTWPVPWDAWLHADQARHGYWLKSLTPKEEVAKCIVNRYFILHDTGRFPEALQCLGAAQRFEPDRAKMYQECALLLFRKMLQPFREAIQKLDEARDPTAELYQKHGLPMPASIIAARNPFPENPANGIPGFETGMLPMLPQPPVHAHHTPASLQAIHTGLSNCHIQVSQFSSAKPKFPDLFLKKG